MITWGDVVDIIIETFNIKQAKLADLLGYKKDAITKMKYGKMAPSSSLSNEDIFNRVFYPATADSPAYKYGDTDNLAPCLEAVKDTINDTPFPDVRKDMDDMWKEKDYKIFVCKLLSRAEKGPSSRIKPKKAESENSNDNGEDAAACDSANNEILDTKPKKIPPEETASKQMREIFAEAVAKYNVASCICSLSYFLQSGPNYDFNIDCFIKFIQDGLLSKFINYQNECVYKEISQFIITLESYMDSISFFDPTISEFYGNMLKAYGYSATLDRADKDYNELKSSSIDGKPVNNTSNNLSLLDFGFKLGQLDCIRSALRAYNRLDELYSKIFPDMELRLY